MGNETKVTNFMLDKETSRTIDDFKWELDCNRSNVVKKIVKFIKKDPKILEQIKNDDSESAYKQNEKNKEK